MSDACPRAPSQVRAADVALARDDATRAAAARDAAPPSIVEMPLVDDAADDLAFRPSSWRFERTLSARSDAESQRFEATSVRYDVSARSDAESQRLQRSQLSDADDALFDASQRPDAEQRLERSQRARRADADVAALRAALREDGGDDELVAAVFAERRRAPLGDAPLFDDGDTALLDRLAETADRDEQTAQRGSQVDYLRQRADALNALNEADELLLQRTADDPAYEQLDPLVSADLDVAW